MKCRSHVEKRFFMKSWFTQAAKRTRWLSLPIFCEVAVEILCWVPAALQQENCIQIQSAPLCVSVIQHTIVSGICIRAMKFSPLAFSLARWEAAVEVPAYQLLCCITFYENASQGVCSYERSGLHPLGEEIQYDTKLKHQPGYVTSWRATRRLLLFGYWK